MSLRPANVCWDALPAEEPDPIPPPMCEHTCRHCLTTGVILDMSKPAGERWTYGCTHCGVGFEGVAE